MATNIWGVEEDFWTEVEDSEEEEEVVEQPLKAQPAWLSEFEAKREEIEDGQFIGSAEGFGQNVEELEEPEPRVQSAPGAAKIRKRWVIEDRTDVTDFRSKFPDGKMALEYPFELDDFQKRAILHVEKNEHIIVCAHTSAGKTVVAEYGIALAQQRKLRAIYTSPIKALSNQKYREFLKVFDSVGIITGDVHINKDAQCLIMTTEILRSLLYKNDPLLGQIGCVIYDEVHYINDSERGVVWEESIIMMPEHIPMIMLSATVPNYIEFAQWVGVTKQREVFVVSTTHRPTPLKHYIFINKKPYLIMDERGHFSSTCFNLIFNDMRSANKAKEEKQKTATRGGRGGRGGGGSRGGGTVFTKVQTADQRQKTERYHLQEYLDFLQKSEGLPVVIFAFSRNKCEQYASDLPSLKCMTAEHRNKCKVFMNQSLSGLSAEDKALPQIKFVQQLADKGIGVHHGGLLPIVKEMVEIMFSRSMIHVLFATETFAMGVNMPARSVMLSSLKKHDGRQNRLLLGTEYIQMAGRAGRRGLDEQGNVYIFCPNNEPPATQDVYSVLTSKAKPIQSKFRLTLAMLLSLVTRQSVKPSDFMAKSFLECERAQALPTIVRDTNRLKAELAEMREINCIFGNGTGVTGNGKPDIEAYVDTELRCRELAAKIYSSLYESNYSREIFCVGRLSLLHSISATLNACYGVLLESYPPQGASHPRFKFLVLLPNFVKNFVLQESGNMRVMSEGAINVTDQLLGDRARDIELAISQGPGAYLSCSRYAVVDNVGLDHISALIEFVLDMPQGSWNEVAAEEPRAASSGLSSAFAMQGFTIQQPKQKQRKSKQQAAPVTAKDVTQSATDLDYVRLATAVNAYLLENKVTPFTIPPRMKTLPMDLVFAANEHHRLAELLVIYQCHNCPERQANVSHRLRQLALQEKIAELEFKMSAESLELMPDYHGKLVVLKEMGFISETNAITLKGRAACEMMVNDELALTEALFAHKFQNLSVAGIAAVVSSFVVPEINKSAEPPSGLEEADYKQTMSVLESIMQIHDDIGARLQMELGEFDIETWTNLCNPAFAPVTFMWASGMPFATLMERCDSIHEGTIVRAIVRLDEMIKKMRNVCHIIGNLELKAKFVAVSEAIHRDIVFANSLYLQ